jgi:predicted phosphoribosyltransferase
LAIGAVADGEEPTAIRNSDVIELSGVNEEEFDAVCNEKRAEIERRRKRNLGDRARSEVRGRVTIIIDDRIATGATTLPAIRAVLMWKPKELVLAIPVAPLDTIKRRILKSTGSPGPRSSARSAISTVIFTKSATTR